MEYDLFTIWIETGFKAGHQLRLGQGRVEDMHSHDWIVRVGVRSDKLDEMGLAVDFNILKAALEKTIAPFKGRRLEELDCFSGVNTSAENVAVYIYDTLEPLLAEQIKLDYVEVMEAPGCWVKYSR